MRQIKRNEDSYIIADGVICRDDENVTVRDGSRVIRVFHRNEKISSLMYESVELPVFTEDRVLLMEYHHGWCPVIKSDNWSVESPNSSIEYVKGKMGGVSWKEFIDVLIGDVKLDELMNDKWNKGEKTNNTELNINRGKAYKALGIEDHWSKVYGVDGSLLCDQFSTQSEVCSDFHIKNVLKYLEENTTVDIFDVYRIESPWRGKVVEFDDVHISKVRDMF